MNQTIRGLRNDLAYCIRDLKRDYKKMDEENIQYDLGYIMATANALNKFVDPEYYQYEIPECKRINDVCNRIALRVTFQDD